MCGKGGSVQMRCCCALFGRLHTQQRHTHKQALLKNHMPLSDLAQYDLSTLTGKGRDTCHDFRANQTKTTNERPTFNGQIPGSTLSFSPRTYLTRAHWGAGWTTRPTRTRCLVRQRYVVTCVSCNTQVHNNNDKGQRGGRLGGHERTDRTAHGCARGRADRADSG